ncbi:monocyte to macrophage differentiation factor 2 isoform X3 [Hippoglossus stenolepis]|uniref:monocyte to macrophage differentiation factor 2 isoform X3 n=1 Tax=Hippoglossus stenolepis TaxID=195615 RepID=UPI00159C67B5|nr:monocyte to macrophage differentiation factor 2 isoform X3 [Hippoglossus stenolepis]
MTREVLTSLRTLNCLTDKISVAKGQRSWLMEACNWRAVIVLWILPSLVGVSVLYFLSVDQWHRVAAWLYGSGLTGLFVTSTLFHTAAWKISHLRRVEQRFHMCDRMAIYFFIAASYSPWLMLRELGPWTCHMRWLIWVMACVGSTYVFFFHERYKLLELVGYVAMGAVPAAVILSMIPLMCYRWSALACVNWRWEVSSTWWGWSSLRATAWSRSPTPSGIYLSQLEQEFIITPSGGTCTCPGRCCCTRRGDRPRSAGVAGSDRK